MYMFIKREQTMITHCVYVCKQQETLKKYKNFSEHIKKQKTEV